MRTGAGRRWPPTPVRPEAVWSSCEGRGTAWVSRSIILLAGGSNALKRIPLQLIHPDASVRRFLRWSCCRAIMRDRPLCWDARACVTTSKAMKRNRGKRTVYALVDFRRSVPAGDRLDSSQPARTSGHLRQSLALAPRDAHARGGWWRRIDGVGGPSDLHPAEVVGHRHDKPFVVVVGAPYRPVGPPVTRTGAALMWPWMARVKRRGGGLTCVRIRSTATPGCSR